MRLICYMLFVYIKPSTGSLLSEYNTEIYFRKGKKNIVTNQVLLRL